MPRRFAVQFSRHLHKQSWWKPGSTYVLALSGGMDSMALASLMRFEDCKLVLAHVNFKLRGESSDGDEKFVCEQAKQWGIPIETTSFATMGYALEHGISIEMAARDLRYAWFDEVLKKHQAQGVLTAHHANDLAETVLLNMSRGMGIYGLDGIPIKSGNFFRPLLFAGRDQIAEYVRKERIPYRDDASNLEIDIQRNRVRHEVIPELMQINPKAVEHIGQSAGRVQQMMNLFHEYLNILKQEFYISDNIINLELLKEREDADVILFEFLRDLGVHGDAIPDILRAKSGAQFLTDAYALWINRGKLEICERGSQDFEKVMVEGPGCVHFLQGDTLRQLCIDSYELHSREQLAADPMCVYVPVDLLKFPLSLRTWKKGDVFLPFGMKKRKKLSDFFIDEKYSPIEKHTQLLLCAQDQIIWVVGKRLSERMRVQESETSVYRIMIE